MGFGADSQKDFTEQKLDSLLNLVGMDKVKLVDGKIIKLNPNIILDFNNPLAHREQFGCIKFSQFFLEEIT